MLQKLQTSVHPILSLHHFFSSHHFILLVKIFRNIWRTVWRIQVLMLGLMGCGKLSRKSDKMLGEGGEGQPEMDWHSIQEGVEVFPCHFILWKLHTVVILCADRE